MLEKTLHDMQGLNRLPSRSRTSAPSQFGQEPLPAVAVHNYPQPGLS